MAEPRPSSADRACPAAMPAYALDPEELAIDILAVLDHSSFLSVWFWIVMAFAWVSATHTVLGVPFDSIVRADWNPDVFETEVDQIAHASAHRLAYLWDKLPLIIVGGVAFGGSGLLVMAVGYRIEMAQAAATILVPLAWVRAREIRLAHRIRREDLHGNRLRRKMVFHRFMDQLIGVGSISVAAILTAMRALETGALLRVMG